MLSLLNLTNSVRGPVLPMGQQPLLNQQSSKPPRVLLPPAQKSEPPRRLQSLVLQPSPDDEIFQSGNNTQSSNLSFKVPYDSNSFIMGEVDDQKLQELLERDNQKLLQLVQNLNILSITDSSGTNTSGGGNYTQIDLKQRLDEIIEKINDDPCIKDKTKEVLIKNLNAAKNDPRFENYIKINSEGLEQIDQLIDQKPDCPTQPQRSGGPNILTYLGVSGALMGALGLARMAWRGCRRPGADPGDRGAMPPATRFGIPTGGGRGADPGADGA